MEANIRDAVTSTTFLFIVSVTIIELINRARARFNSRKGTFDDALSTDDLKTLGKYFSTKFGKVPITAYVRNGNTRESVNKILSRLSEYVTPPSEESVESALPPIAEKRTKPKGEQSGNLKLLLEPLPSDPPALRRAIQSVASGDEWSGLARVRRDLERRIQERVSVPSRLPIYRLVQMLEPPPAVHAAYRSFSKIANAAVHGTDVEPVLALQALDSARKVYAWLDRLPLPNQIVSGIEPLDD